MFTQKNIAALIFITISILYLFLPGVVDGTDSIRLSLWASKNEIFVHGQQNHLLQLFLNSLLNKLMIFLGLRIPIDKLLQILGALFGALGVSVFYLFLYDIFKNRIAALTGCLGLAFSCEYWHYSTIIETHIMPIALLIIVLYQINKLQINSKTRYVVTAALVFVAAIYLSEVYIFFIFSPLALILLSDLPANQKKTSALTFLLTIIICWLIPFGIIGYFVSLRNNAGNQGFSHFFISIYKWFRGTHAIIGFKFVNIPTLISNAFWETIFKQSGCNSSNILAIALSSLFVIFIMSDYKGAVAAVKKYYKLFIFWFVSIIFPLAIQLIYQPWNTQRYTPFLIFNWIILSMCALNYRKTRSKVIKLIPILLCLGLFVLNLFVFAIPQHDKKNSCLLEASLFLKSVVKEGDSICIVGKRSLTFSLCVEYYLGIKAETFTSLRSAKKYIDECKLKGKQKILIVLLPPVLANQLGRILHKKSEELFSNHCTVIYYYKINIGSDVKC